jgi:hypothetical protein
MIAEYVNKLIENLPDDVKNRLTPLKIDLVLDGGAFNGSYLIGALYFLKEMEKRKYVTVDRISGCSIGSVVGLLYIIDSLDLMAKIYDIMFQEIKTTYHFNAIKQLKTILGDKIPEDVCNRANKKLFITYNNIQKGTKPVKNVYRDVNDLINTIIRSCFIPFVIDGNILYEDKHIDGINPFIFDKEPDKKVLYLNLMGVNKLGHIWNVKNEKTNYHRLMTGLLDIHSFYIKQSNTDMCSYVEDWSFTRKYSTQLKVLIERVIVFIVYFLVYIKKYTPLDLERNVMCKIATRVIQDIYIVLLETYCL